MRIEPGHPHLARAEWLDSAPSTNTVLRERAVAEGADAWPDASVVVTATQTAGRGRLDRTWVAPADSGLAISVLLRPRTADGEAIEPDRWSWLPLMAGLAMASAVREAAAASAVDPVPEITVKWPNDVLIDGRKVSGLLAELLPDASGVVIGAGVNIRLAHELLPVPTATSLLVAGLMPPGSPAPDALLYGTYIGALLAEYRAWTAVGGDAERSGLAARARAGCGTLGRRVRALLPDGSVLEGLAAGIDATGRLEILEGQDCVPRSVAAGDVTHLRY